MDKPPAPPKKLSATDIQNMLDDNDKLKKLPTLNIFGLKVDTQSFSVVIIALILWLILWLSFGIFTIVPYANVFFIIYIFISITNLFNSAIDVSDVESERMNMSSQQNYIQGAISIFILAFVFLYNVKMDDESAKQTYKVLIISLMISCVAIIIINVKNISKNIRFVRKIQQMVFNQGLILFLLALFMIYKFKVTKKI